MPRVKFNVSAGDSCPYCKIGRIVQRHGRYGEFYACDTYPGCHFAQNIIAQKDPLELQADEILKSVV